MRPSVLFIVFLVGGLLFSSCASTSKITHIELLPAEEIVRKLHERESSIRTIEAEGILTVESPEQSGTMNFELQLRQRDTLWMKFSGPFGITLGTFMLTPEKFIFYSAREKRRITGIPKPEILSRVFNVSFSYNDIINAVTGSFNRIDGDDEIVSNAVAENRYYVLHASGSSTRKELWIDAEAFVTTKFAEYNQDNRLLVVGTSSRVESVDGTYMPHLIRIILPPQRQSATLAYSTVRVNRAYQKKFTIPHDAKEFFIEQSR